MTRPGPLAILVVILACFALVMAAVLLTVQSLVTSRTAEDHFDIPLPSGGMEARYVPGHSLGDILRADAKTIGGDGGDVRIYVGERGAFRQLIRALDDGADPGDIASAEDGMLFAGNGPELSLSLKLSDRRYLVGALNLGPKNCTLDVDLMIMPQPQYIMICFSIPLVLVAVAGSWAAAREGGSQRGGSEARPPRESGYDLRRGYGDEMGRPPPIEPPGVDPTEKHRKEDGGSRRL